MIPRAFAIATAACALLAGCSQRESVTHAATFTVGAPSTYVSVRFARASNRNISLLGVTDVRTGRLIQSVHPVPWDGMQVMDTALDGRGHLWVTLSVGPVLRDGTMGGNPQPGSCRSEILDLDPRGDSSRVVVRATSDELITAAAPSPDGSHVAYRTGGCTTSYFNQSIRVDDLGTGTHVSIGAGLAPCHQLGAPRWTVDGRRLAFTYGPPDPKQVGQGLGPGRGESCAQPLPSTLTVVAADHTQPGMTGSTVSAPHQTCDIAAATPDADGYAAIEACGVNYLTGPARLIRFDPHLRAMGATPLGSCADGTQVAADHSGTHLLISSYQFCNPPGTGSPRTLVLTAAASGGPATERGSTRGGVLNPSAIAW
jgi:hypothetical protein